jgi:hypothetical protein
MKVVERDGLKTLNVMSKVPYDGTMPHTVSDFGHSYILVRPR